MSSSSWRVPRFVLLRILHKIVFAITVSLDHLAGLYTPAITSDGVISSLEGAVIGVLGESNRTMMEEVGCLVDDVSAPERREVVDEMKQRIVEMLIDERASIAFANR